MADRLILHEVIAECRLGVFDWERTNPQRIWVDLELEIDASKAAARDEMREAVDYAQLVKLIQQTAQAQPYRLLETLAERMAQAILKASHMPWVRLRIKKRALEGIDYAAVEVERMAGRARRRRATARGRSVPVTAR